MHFWYHMVSAPPIVQYWGLGKAASAAAVCKE